MDLIIDRNHFRAPGPMCDRAVHVATAHLPPGTLCACGFHLPPSLKAHYPFALERERGRKQKYQVHTIEQLTREREFRRSILFTHEYKEESLSKPLLIPPHPFHLSWGRVGLIGWTQSSSYQHQMKALSHPSAAGKVIIIKWKDHCLPYLQDENNTIIFHYSKTSQWMVSHPLLAPHPL